MFFLQLRLSAMRMKMLMQRMYATMFSVMYMGTSGITGATNFSNTALFSFIDTFCFHPLTKCQVKNRGAIPIIDVKIGDVLLPTNSVVHTKFIFDGRGQRMVNIGKQHAQQRINVSTNHYLWSDTSGVFVRAEDHPDAEDAGICSTYLVCLNTSDHKIPIDSHIFLDYDETDNHIDAMKQAEEILNNSQSQSKHNYENSPAVHPDTGIVMKNGSVKTAGEIFIGDVLSTNSRIIGKIYRKISQYCITGDNEYLTPATLSWDYGSKRWQRIGETYPVINTEEKAEAEAEASSIWISFIVLPSCSLQLDSGRYIRDYMEVCSPDMEKTYMEQIRGNLAPSVLLNYK
jgi:hypothetical protein